MELDGRVALVTGASRRLGLGVARALAAKGVAIAVHYRSSRETAVEAAATLAASGVEAWPVRADLARPAEVERLVDRVGERFGGLDLLVNSAASFEDRPLAEIDAAAWDAVMAVNLRAPFLLVRRAAPLLAERPRRGGSPGAVVNIGDLSGLDPWPGYLHHGVSKAGLLHLTRAAALELGPDVRVNSVVPGPILPPPGTDARSRAWRRRGDGLPAGRTGTPEEVGAAVVFLAQNDFVTGASITVDGGESLVGHPE